MQGGGGERKVKTIREERDDGDDDEGKMKIITMLKLDYDCGKKE